MLTKEEGPNQFGNKLYTFDCRYVLEVPKEYQVKEIIGHGGYGIVCSAFNSSTDEHVAIKKYNKIFDDDVVANRILREIKILNLLSHPNIISIKDIFRPTDPTNFNDLYIVTELMEVDLKTVLKNSKQQLTLLQCQYIILELLFALQYIHSANILHRDVKPANVLINLDLSLKLCDFGLAREICKDMSFYVVTRWYRSPELLLGCQEYGYGVDLWSLGCLAVEMITSMPLFPGKDYKHQLTLITSLLGPLDIERDMPAVETEFSQHFVRELKHERSSLEKFIPQIRHRFNEDSFYDSYDADDHSKMSSLSPRKQYELFEDFILGLLKYKPNDRLTASQAIMHPWLAELLNLQTEWEGSKTTAPLNISFEKYDSSASEIIRQFLILEIDKFAERKRLNAKNEN
ncbi:unnamed protein product, partial [Phytomonas sp. EM1]